ncbi:hypothetical protein CHARACLAT_012580 [Characodon lateralis]|uniref:Secreted protein n=1 Tax=Characodon lateralis TaxID=208331 RepID=A0ABU7E0Q2_9TELE|nr:hypothetical protein [Characodon lateralis]
MFYITLLLLLAAGSCVKCEQLTQPASVTLQPGLNLFNICQVFLFSEVLTHWITVCWKRTGIDRLYRSEYGVHSFQFSGEKPWRDSKSVLQRICLHIY